MKEDLEEIINELDTILNDVQEQDKIDTWADLWALRGYVFSLIDKHYLENVTKSDSNNSVDD